MVWIRKKKILPFLVLLFIIHSFIIGLAYGQELVVAGNPGGSSVSLEDIKRIYLGFVKALPDGTPARPLIMKGVPENFYLKVIGMSRKDFRVHWMTKALSGETILPRELGEDEIISLIKTDKGAIGVVSTDKAKREGLKILVEIK